MEFCEHSIELRVQQGDADLISVYIAGSLSSKTLLNGVSQFVC